MTKAKKIFLIITTVIFVTIIISVCVIAFGNSNAKYQDLIFEIDKAWTSALTEDQPKYLSKIDEKSSYSITKIKKEDEEYIISVSVDAPDLGGKLSMLSYDELPQTEDIDELNDFLCTKIDNATNCNTKTEIYATKIDGKYNISFSDEFVDAMSGKIYSYSSNVLMDEIQSKYGGEVK